MPSAELRLISIWTTWPTTVMLWTSLICAVITSITYTIYRNIQKYISYRGMDHADSSAPPPNLSNLPNFLTSLTSQICQHNRPLKFFDLPNLPKFPTYLSCHTSWPSYPHKLSDPPILPITVIPLRWYHSRCIRVPEKFLSRIVTWWTTD
jgi:hypothetical protein